MVGEYAPDALWALLLFWAFSLPFSDYRPTRFFGHPHFTFAIEYSQFYQAEWIMAARRTFFWVMPLGHGFLGPDLVCYATGILVGWGLAIKFFDRRAAL